MFCMKKVKENMNGISRDRYIYRVLEWLPLNDKEEGISSGNVGV